MSNPPQCPSPSVEPSPLGDVEGADQNVDAGATFLEDVDRAVDVGSTATDDVGDEWLNSFEDRFEERAQKALDGKNVNQQPPALAAEVEEINARAPQPATEEPFKVDDRVIWDNCPGHFASWGNPFTISAIQGDMAELDLVEYLVPLAQLRRLA